MKKIRLFIEAYPITEEHISGIGHMTLETIYALQNHPDNGTVFEVVLIVNKDRVKRLERWGFNSEKVRIKSIFLPTRPFNIIWKFDLLPYMNLLLGSGIYVFFNYKNWRLIGSKSMTYVCDVSYLLYPEFVSPKNQKFLETNIRKWVRRTNKVLAISENARQEIIEHLQVAEDKIALIPCGVNTKMYYRRDQAEITALKQVQGLVGKYILYIGNIEPRKNISGLLEAYKQLPDELREEYTLVLVGGGGWLNESIFVEIETMQKAGYNVVRPNSYINDKDLPALFSGASLLVHPALYEGFGISPLQAMACEVPVVVADNSSLPEVVGDAAVMVKADNPADISDKIKTVLTDSGLQAVLRKKGMQRINKFSWTDSASRLVEEARKLNAR